MDLAQASVSHELAGINVVGGASLLCSYLKNALVLADRPDQRATFGDAEAQPLVFAERATQMQIFACELSCSPSVTNLTVPRGLLFSSTVI